MYALFRKLFAKQIKRECEDSFHAGKQEARDESWQTRLEGQLIVMKEMIGTPIISVGNEWDNPVVGFATEIQYIGKSPLLVGKDYVTGREALMFSQTFAYTEQRFSALMKLDPFERACLIYGVPSHAPFDKYKRETVNTEAEIVDMLTANGFYEKLAEYRQAVPCE